MRLRDEDCALILGIRGSGKSHYAKHRIVRGSERVVVWDPNAEYADACDLDEVSLEEFTREAPELLESEKCRLSVVPEWDEPAELAEQFAEFRTELKAGPHERATLIVADECALLRQQGDGALVGLAAQSRHWRMPLVLIAQRAMMVAPGARAQASLIVSFRQNDPKDIAALAERIGQERAAKVAALPRRRFVVWSEQEAFRETPRDGRVSGVV